MNFSVEDLEHHKRGSGIEAPPDIDIKALIDNMGSRIRFTGMNPVGR